MNSMDVFLVGICIVGAGFLLYRSVTKKSRTCCGDCTGTCEKKRPGSAIVWILCISGWIAFSGDVCFSADIESRLLVLEEMMKKQQKIIEEQQKTIDALKSKPQPPVVGGGVSVGAEAKSDGKVELAKGSKGGVGEKEESVKVSGAVNDFFKNIKNPAITLTLNSFYYSSSVNERKIKNRGITGFSSIGPDQKKGFNIDEVSLAVFAPVDKYFDLFGVLSHKEEGSSVEEAYFYTKMLPADLRLKGGKFKSNFSVHNETHPHEWDFADTPLIYQGFLGRDGVMEKGVQLTFRPKLPLSPFLGVEVLQGENPIMFNKNSSGGPYAFTGFLKGAYEFDKTANLYFGPYVISGKTQTDSVADGTLFRGNSNLYGFESIFSWEPSKGRALTLQGEYMWRTQAGSLLNYVNNNVERLTRSQDGMYLQALYQMDKWRVGLRYDRLNLFTKDFTLAGTQRDFKNPYRLTGALEYNPSEYSRFRLQYNYDRSGGGSIAYGGGSRTNHELYFQMVFAIGAHIEPKGQRD